MDTGFTEKALEKAILETKVQRGATAIVMDPRNGDILALASKPDFNLNNVCPSGGTVGAGGYGPYKLAEGRMEAEINLLRKLPGETGRLWMAVRTAPLSRWWLAAPALKKGL